MFKLKGKKIIAIKAQNHCLIRHNFYILFYVFQLHDDNYLDFFMDQSYPNAVYTHQYDDTGTRMFVAGGPLPAGLWGNYAGIWS